KTPEHGHATSSELHRRVRFMDRSGCGPTALSLEGIPLAVSNIIVLLNHTPSVYTFTLSKLWTPENENELHNEESPSKVHKVSLVPSSNISKLQPRCLLCPAVQIPLLHKFTSIELVVHARFEADQVFVAMVKSRWDRPNGDMGQYPTERLKTMLLYVMNRKLVKRVYEPLNVLDAVLRRE
ncbi:hypothetical protein V5O48_018978, partial [Marasmius crinis-equi]